MVDTKPVEQKVSRIEMHLTLMNVHVDTTNKAKYIKLTYFTVSKNNSVNFCVLINDNMTQIPASLMTEPIQ